MLWRTHRMRNKVLFELELELELECINKCIMCLQSIPCSLFTHLGKVGYSFTACESGNTVRVKYLRVLRGEHFYWADR